MEHLKEGNDINPHAAKAEAITISWCNIRIYFNEHIIYNDRYYKSSSGSDVEESYFVLYDDYH